MQFQEHVAIGSKTTMRIGGTARYYAELMTKQDVEEAVAFAREKNIPLIPLGGGSNTIFADTEVNALVVRIKADAVRIDVPSTDTERIVHVESGKILASLIVELAKQNMDLSALTGIPGTIGGAIFGNAGQGPKGVWMDTYVESVEVFMDNRWQMLTKDACNFRYRESKFKDMSDEWSAVSGQHLPPILWSTALRVPSRPGPEIQATIESLLKKRIETQPHLKTAGSCFKALPDGTPAWKLIDAAGLRGKQVGGIQISEKHANFLLNVEKGSFTDAIAITELIKKTVPQIAGIEMRFYGEDGKLLP
jgi:UDP-N-acetylmuramate dehydrogenase